MWGTTANQAMGQMSEEAHPLLHLLPGFSQEVGVVTRDSNTVPGLVWGWEGLEEWRRCVCGGGLGVSFFLVCVVHGFPKVLMQPTSPFVQSVQMKENDSAQFRLLHMETLNSERQGCLCLAKARGVKGPPSRGKKIPSAFKCRP